MDEQVLAAVVGRDEPVAPTRVEELHRAAGISGVTGGHGACRLLARRAGRLLRLRLIGVVVVAGDAGDAVLDVDRLGSSRVRLLGRRMDHEVANGGLGDRLVDPDTTLHLERVLLLTVIEQRHHGAGGAGASGTSGAVQVGRVLGRRVVVDHGVHAVDVDAASRDVGGDQR